MVCYSCIFALLDITGSKDFENYSIFISGIWEYLIVFLSLGKKWLTFFCCLKGWGSRVSTQVNFIDVINRDKQVQFKYLNPRD